MVLDILHEFYGKEKDAAFEMKSMDRAQKNIDDYDLTTWTPGASSVKLQGNHGPWQ